MFKITKFNLCVIGMFVGIGLNIQRQVSLEMNQPGLNYLVLAVQFADGTSGVYSGVMDVDAFSSKSQGENYLDYQLDETDSETRNVFHTKDIDAAIEKGKLYDPNTPNTFAKKCMGIDPAYGSSSFGIVVTQFVDGHVQILHAEEYKRPDFNEMLVRAWDLLVKYAVQKIYIDGANPSFIKSLKIQWGERPD
jgi:hypothetical protein